MSNGIDYGAGKVNIDLKTRIRYGVIPAHSCMQEWCDNSEPVYSNTCPHCGNEPISGGDITGMLRCPTCHKKLSEGDFDYSEPIGFKLDDGEYFATQSHDDPDIFIEKSPYFTYAKFCSPCAPGACYLENPLDTPDPDNRAFCFGHDFFEEGKAPYRIYSCKTGKEALS